MCFGCSKEPSHRDGSFEYPQHMIWLRKKNIQLHTLIWGPEHQFEKSSCMGSDNGAVSNNRDVRTTIGPDEQYLVYTILIINVINF